jgi:hypothetical protein
MSLITTLDGFNGDMLTTKNNVVVAQFELMEMLIGNKFPLWEDLLVNDYNKHKQRLDGWDSFVNRETVRRGSFSSRRTIVNHALNSGVYYSNNSLVMSDAFFHASFELSIPVWKARGVNRIVIYQDKISIDLPCGTQLQMRRNYGANQGMCSKINASYDFIRVGLPEANRRSDDAQKWVDYYFIPYLMLGYEASALIKASGHADEFTKNIRGLMSATGHDFPVHAGTDCEEFAHRTSHVCSVIDRLNYMLGVKNNGFGYENFCLVVNSNIFYEIRELGFTAEIMSHVFPLLEISRSLACSHNSAAVAVGEGVQEMVVYFLSNYVERNKLANKDADLQNLLNTGRAGHDPKTFPIADAAKEGRDYLKVGEICVQISDAVEKDNLVGSNEQRAKNRTAFIQSVMAR